MILQFAWPAPLSLRRLSKPPWDVIAQRNPGYTSKFGCTVRMIPSLYRKYTNTALASIPYYGEVLDLGGSRTSEYMRPVMAQAARVTVVNLDPSAQPDIEADLEKPLPCPDGSFDQVLAINTLEHVYHVKELLAEAHRVLRPGGELIIAVPFLYQVHLSPNDYFRYTWQALERMVQDLSLQDVVMQELGCGVMQARYQLLYNFLPTPCAWVGERLAKVQDRLLSALARIMRRQYQPTTYPLGYILRAKKSAA